MPGCRIEGAFYSPWSMPPGDICRVCTPELSTTAWSPANEGMSCWSGDPSAGSTSCQNGACTGSEPVDCRPLTACHTAELNPVTGQCEQGFAEAGTPCGGRAMCYGEFYQPSDTCDGNGFCIGGGSQTRPCAPYRCGAGACTTACETDLDCADGAHCDDGQCFPDADLGQPCDEDSDCQSGTCAYGVCCNQRCEGRCETCSAETGGFCSPVVCDDGLSCTSGVCDETTGECRHSLHPGACLIDGVCYASGDYEPETACFRCMPDERADDWTPVGCFLDLPCVRNACKKGGDCEYMIKPDSCLIDGVCYADGDLNPNNSCQMCDSARDLYVWSDHSAIRVDGTCATTVAGAITADDPRGICTLPDVPYELHTLVHPGGSVHLRAQSSDRFMYPQVLIFTAFNPAQPCLNQPGSYHGSCNDGTYISNSNLAAGEYTVLVAGYGAFGSYSLRVDQDDAC